MNGKKINNPLVLVTPMDWGLGHATRCIPIIKALLEQGCRVMLAASGSSRLLLLKEFPRLACLDIRGYDIHYGRSKKGVWLSLFIQLPKILSTIRAEHSWLKKIIKQYEIDAVISDNRMGMFCAGVYCIYITHQLQIQTGNRLTNWLARKIHYWFIHKFNECWVPDSHDENNLAGALSHPASLPRVPVKYIGPISRFENAAVEKKYDIAVILSGPEPQRSIFERLVLDGAPGLPGRLLLVRGSFNGIAPQEINHPAADIYDFSDARDLNQAILQSDLIISRCGYSTIMDLVKLQKKAVLVPTPGQTEQEYLAAYLSFRKIFCCIDQKKFSLSHALKASEAFSFRTIRIKEGGCQNAVKEFISTLPPRQ